MRAHTEISSTRMEIRLWCELLRKKQMMGFSFLRQRPIGNFIADFFCKEHKLVIEVDGASHEYVKKKDEHRTRELINLGYAIIRCTDDDVMNDIDGVKERIEAWIHDNRPQSLT